MLLLVVYVVSVHSRASLEILVPLPAQSARSQPRLDYLLVQPLVFHVMLVFLPTLSLDQLHVVVVDLMYQDL